jgi:hypothetical protein
MSKSKRIILALQLGAAFLSLLVILFVHNLAAVMIKVNVWLMAKTSTLKPKLIGGIHATRTRLKPTHEG